MSLFDDILERSSPSGKPLTMASLNATITAFKMKYPDRRMVKEIRLLDHQYIKKIVPDPPKEDLPTAFGIPVIVDDSVPANKIKLVFRDGHERTFDV